MDIYVRLLLIASIAVVVCGGYEGFSGKVFYLAPMPETTTA